MSYNTEKKLFKLKAQLVKAEAVLESSEFKKKKAEWENELADILLSGEGSYYQSRYDHVFQEEEIIHDLRMEISDLEWELAEKRELDELNSCAKVVDSATGVVLAYVSHSSL